MASVPVVMLLLLVSAIFWLGLVVHEGGHALMACILDAPPRTIVLGWGPVVLRKRIGRVRLIIRPIPIGGWVQIIPPVRSVRLRMLLFQSAGILANIAVFAIVASITARFNLNNLWNIVAFSQLWFAGWAAFPFSYSKAPRLGSDGLQILRMIFKPQRADLGERYSKLLQQYPDAHQPLSPCPEFREILFQIARHYQEPEAWARRDAYAALRDVMLQDRIAPAERILVSEQLITNEVTYRDTGMTREELEDWSREMLALSDATTLRATRGCALVLLGEFAVAREMLLRVLEEDPTPTDAMVSRAFLAEAAAKEQDVAGAQHWSNEARLHIPGDQSAKLLPLLAQLERAAI